jgi:hypothetical protein
MHRKLAKKVSETLVEATTVTVDEGGWLRACHLLFDGGSRLADESGRGIA